MICTENNRPGRLRPSLAWMVLLPLVFGGCAVDPASDPPETPEEPSLPDYVGHGFELWLDGQPAALPDGRSCWELPAAVSTNPVVRFSVDEGRLGSYRRCELNIQPLREGVPNFRVNGRVDTYGFRPASDQRLAQGGLQWVEGGVVSQLDALPTGKFNLLFTVYGYRDGAPTWDRKQLHVEVR